jgi:large repetitive protein
VLTNDSDPDGASLTAILVAGPSHGTLTLNANGTFAYAPTANYNGPDSFTYRASDGALTSVITTVNLTVTPMNDAPVAVVDGFTVAEDGALAAEATRNVLSNDTDPDTGTVLSAVLVAGPSNGTLTLNANGTFAYTPTANYNGPDSFTYRASDGTLTSAITTVNLTVTPVNDAPVITYNNGNATPISILENTSPILAQVLASDLEGGVLTYALAGIDAGDFTIGANAGRFRHEQCL